MFLNIFSIYRDGLSLRVWVPKEIWLEIWDSSPAVYGKFNCTSKEITKEVRRILPKFEAVRRWTKNGMLPNGKKNGILYEERQCGIWTVNEEKFWINGKLINNKMVMMYGRMVEMSYLTEHKKYYREGPFYGTDLMSNGITLWANNVRVYAMIFKDRENALYYKEEEREGTFEMSYSNGRNVWTPIGSFPRPRFWEMKKLISGES